MQWLEYKYAMQLSNRLEKFKRKSDRVFNFRCPLCGDSQTSKSKARGYIYLKSGNYFFICHNCGVSTTFRSFLKELDHSAYLELVKESLLEQGKGQAPKQPWQTTWETQKNKDIELPKISQLKFNHPAKRYIDQRKIPPQYHAKLFYAQKFKEFTNSYLPEKFDEESMARGDEPRIVIPFRTQDGELTGFQGRALNPQATVRYISISLNEGKKLLFNLDTVNFNKTYYVFEGPFDSMFIANSIAVAGGDLTHDLSLMGVNRSNGILVYDNEPRNPHTIEKMNKAIGSGFRICIWPEQIKAKDVNEMVTGGMLSSEIQHVIDTNACADLKARMRLTTWKKS